MSDTDPTAITLAADPALPLEEVPAGWQIDSLSALEWAMERLAAVAAERQENAVLLREMHERLDLRAAALDRPLEADATRLEVAILAYAAAHRGELCKGKKKSRTLPAGQVGWRSSGKKLVVTDEAKVLAWAQQQPLETGVYVVKADYSKSAINKLFNDTGEIPDGCTVEEESETAYVKPTVEPVCLGPAGFGALPPKAVLP